MTNDVGEMNAPLREDEVPSGMDREGVRRAVHRLDTLPIEEFPLFMQSLPENGATNENIPLEALQALLYEGTPEEQARNFKTQGNECYALGKPGPLRDAVRFYTRGLEAGCRDPELLATLYLNRSAACLALGHTEDAFKDAQRALSHLAPTNEAKDKDDDEEGNGDDDNKINPSQDQSEHSPSLPSPSSPSPNNCQPTVTLKIKALQRLLKTALSLERPEEARSALTALEQPYGVIIDRDTVERLERLEKRRAQERAAALAEERRLQSIRRLVAGRGLTVAAGVERRLLEHFGPEALESEHQLPTVQAVLSGHRSRVRGVVQPQLAWPVLLLYPEEAQSDWLQAVDEESRLQDILETVLVPSPPWDTEHSYTPSTVHIYWHEAHDGGHKGDDQLVQLHRQVRLKDLIGTLIKTIDRGILSFLVCPAGASGRLLSRYRQLRQWEGE